MSGSSTDSIRCYQATDCAAAGYGIPANAHYNCDSKGICGFDCNSNYTLFSEACWLNGTVSKSCDCDASRPSTSNTISSPTLLPSPTTSLAAANDDTLDDDDVEEVEETITVTETSLSIITQSTASSPLITPPPPPRTTSSRPTKYVTVTQLSISIVPYIPPIVSETRTKTKTQTQTRTKLVTVTSISISTVSPKTSNPKKTQAATSKATSTATGDSCSKSSHCKQKIPQNAHRICLKEICKWRCNKNYLKKGGKCVKKPSVSTKPPIPPCGCVLPSISTVTSVVTKTVQPLPLSTTTSLSSSSETSSSSLSTKTRARSTRKITATVTSTLLSTTEVVPTLIPTTSLSSNGVPATITIFTAASPTTLAPSQTVTVTTPITISISPVRPLPTPRIIYIETCSCDEDCTINVPADASPICDPKVATCTWACNAGFWINSDGTGCLPDGSAFAAFSRRLMVLPPTVTRPHTYSLYIPTQTAEESQPAPTSISSSPASSKRRVGSFAVSSIPSNTSSIPISRPSSTFTNSTSFLIQNYSPHTFLDSFFFADEADESNGFVNYVEAEEAADLELTSFSNSTVTLSMDRASKLSENEARDSVRLSSKEVIQPGSLLVIDLNHIPTGCFVFPSIYLHRANASFPLGTEIDLLDGSSSRDFNQYSVRPPSSCSLSSQVANPEGETNSTACKLGSSCSIAGKPTSSAETMNREGGGVIALQLASDRISLWQWSRSQIPLDVANGSPRSEKWSSPTALWTSTRCDISNTFRDLRLAFDITTCGDWRGKQSLSYENHGSCSSKYPTCEAAVRDSANFSEAFFEINSVKVYSI
ncbi:hypothetical protein JCM5350_002060 [Sporobolomyces pararoseus]